MDNLERRCHKSLRLWRSELLPILGRESRTGNVATEALLQSHSNQWADGSFSNYINLAEPVITSRNYFSCYLTIIHPISGLTIYHRWPPPISHHRPTLIIIKINQSINRHLAWPRLIKHHPPSTWSTMVNHWSNKINKQFSTIIVITLMNH